jgi:hypothetical protein
MKMMSNLSPTHKNSYLDLFTSESDYTNKLPRGRSVRNSTPYIPKHKVIYEEYLKNKERWINKKGFSTNVAKLDLEKKSVIPNYVFVTPAKIPLQKYQFRDVHKEKWVDKKNIFSYKNHHDLVL